MHFFQRRSLLPSIASALLAAASSIHAQQVATVYRPATIIHELDLRGLDTVGVARLLTQLTGQTIIVSQSARSHTVDLSVNEITLESALKAICRSADLVYRYDADGGTYTLMELGDYQKSASGDADGLFVTETFQLEPANLRQIAYALESLFGDRVFLTEGEAPENFAFDPSGSGGAGGIGGGFGGAQDPSGAFGGAATSFNSRQTLIGGGGAIGQNGNSGFTPRNQLGRGGAFGGGGRGQGVQPSEIDREGALAAETARAQSTTNANAAEAERRALARGSATIFVTTNPEHSLLIVRTADRAALTEISDLVVRLNQPVAQVILEMKVLQLDVGNGLTTGVSWQGRQGADRFEVAQRDPKTGAPTAFDFLGQEHNLQLGRFATESAATFAYEFISDELRARVDLLATDNRVEVIATPLLIATNNRSAQIRVGEERVITVGASSERNIAGETGTRNDLITVETEKRTIGTTVRIIPRINQDNTVTLYVQQEATTLKLRNNSIQVGGELIPIDSVDTASVEATVTAKDGNTIAVGGLIRNEVTRNRKKVPLLGDIPVLGRAFRHDVDDARKTELILLITPRLLNKGHQNGGANAMAASEDIMRRLSDHRWHAAGESALEQDNAQLRRYREDRALYDGGSPERKTQHWWSPDQSSLPIPSASIRPPTAGGGGTSTK